MLLVSVSPKFYSGSLYVQPFLAYRAFDASPIDIISTSATVLQTFSLQIKIKKTCSK